MRKYSRPNILISKCLGFEMCRYNGETIRDDFVEKLKPFVNFITACPEVEIGLGIPRFPIRIVVMKSKEERLVQPKTGNDVTEKINSFSEKFLKSITDIDGYILKERSPSCGMKGVKVYLENGNTLNSQGSGFYAKKVSEFFQNVAAEDEGRLKNYKIRDHFLTCLFALSEFRNLKRTASVLTRFHANNKFLLMSYSEKEMRFLGKTAANLEKLPIEKVYKEYETHLKLALKAPSKRSSNINVLQHIMGFFKDTLTKNEKEFFLETLQLYREERIPFISALNILKMWAVRTKNEYLLEQTIFEPYPKELMELKDSGRQIEM